MTRPVSITRRLLLCLSAISVPGTFACSGPTDSNPAEALALGVQALTTETLLAAGDIGDCSTSTDTATGRLLDSLAGTIAVLGDIAYPNGSRRDFTRCFEPAWGRHKSRMRPVPGNHEYQTANASGYFDYFGAAAGERTRGYYSYDLGDWHVVALNSNCSAVGGCGIGSAQERWLRQDLEASPRTCTLAYWHHPRFSSGTHGNASSVSALWQALMDHDAEIVLVGHDHDYERWTAMDATGAATPNGLVEFVVGTGGTALRSFPGSQPANSVVRSSTSHGILKLALSTGGYAWEFVPVAGRTFQDAGSAECH